MSEESSTEKKEEQFATFMSERLDSLEVEVRQTTKYQKVQARKTETYRQLGEAIPEEMQADLKRFTQLWEEMAYYHSQYCYSRGFDDGVMFHSRILGKSKIGSSHIRIEPQNGG